MGKPLLRSHELAPPQSCHLTRLVITLWGYTAILHPTEGKERACQGLTYIILLNPGSRWSIPGLQKGTPKLRICEVLKTWESVSGDNGFYSNLTDCKFHLQTLCFCFFFSLSVEGLHSFIHSVSICRTLRCSWELTQLWEKRWTRTCYYLLEP